jgi:hypothetical protein
MTPDSIGFILFTFFSLLFIFLYLWIGTNKFQKGWRKMSFTPYGMKFAKGYVDIRVFIFIPIVLSLIIWKVFFSRNSFKIQGETIPNFS